MVEGGSVLLICDDEQISDYLSERLSIQGGYAISLAATSHKGISTLRQNIFDIVIVKYDMRDIEFPELVKGLKKIDPDAIIITFLEKTTPEITKDLFKLGVYDFISRPMSFEKLTFLVKKGMELHSLFAVNRRLSYGLKERNDALEKQNLLLAKRIEDSTQNLSRLYEDLRATYMRTIRALAHAIDARDHYTHSHSENVMKYAVAIASEMGLSVKEIETIREACELHDLGKIGVEDSILSKPSSLTEKEWEEIKKHPVTGAKILEPLTFLEDVTELIRQHHEHYDGSGYPEKRKGEDISIGARIIHLADAYEAMRSARAYRKEPLTKEEAIYEIKKNSGTQFDPKVVEAFLKIVDKL